MTSESVWHIPFNVCTAGLGPITFKSNDYNYNYFHNANYNYNYTLLCF